MERDAKYAAVAVFAMLAIAAAVAFVWWYSDRGERRDFVRYEIYFDGSVSGLARGSPVRYLGVDVGRVRGLAIARDNPSRVRVTAEIDSEAPISGATRARLGLLGLTGLLFIDLQQDPAADPARVLGEGQRYPVIPSRKGDIEAFLERLPDLSASRACSPTRTSRQCPPRSRTSRSPRATCQP
jgi:phospholipid/cholesterol/gamma-HCH transport system substrate-binding protein